MLDEETSEEVEEDGTDTSMKRSRLSGRRARKRKEQGGGKIKEENDSQLLTNSFSQGPSSHAKTVPYSCASLMQAKALREAEIHIVDMLAKTVEGSTPASEDIQNSLKRTTSKPLPHIQGTEIHSTAAHSVPIQTLRDDFLLSVFSKPPMVSPVTPSRYTTRHAKMVARQRASLRHIISQEFEGNHLSASPMEPLEAMPRDSSHAPSTYYRRHATTVLHKHANLSSVSTQGSGEKHPGGPASLLLEAAIGNPAPIGPVPFAATTNGREHIPLGEVTTASNIFENRPEESTHNQEQENVHLSQSLTLSLSEMAGLWDDGTSGDSGVGFLAVDSSSVMVGEYRVKEEFAPILRAVLLKHGDIAANCSLQTMQSRSSFLEIVCAIVHKLQTTSLPYLTRVEINCMLAIVVDLELVRIEVGWLHQRLKEILDAMHLVKHFTTLKEEQKKKHYLMEETKKELEALQEKVHLTEDKLAAMKAEAYKFSETISDAKIKVAHLYQRPLLADLL
ncbi:uncharacterized protein LOC117912361 isoform X1 [Vitis riparia]|uniref:uncharacterized protein LOC117912361 isoform X1 n=1 Tax=Vitis riparia TaxID=96939 RepID=UPI00155A0635|nr:uncharacterized protein LOC117912361 isoform X1 [Vitis riparia]